MHRPLPAAVRYLASPAIALLLSQSLFAADAALRIFTPADVHRLQYVGDMAVSPEGDWLAYGVETTKPEQDTTDSNLFMVSWDGTRRLQLSYSEDSSESHPRFSPDGQYLAFIAARNGGDDSDSDKPETKSQVWLLNRSGGEASRLTALPGGVSAFEWSPDSKRLAIVAMDPKKPAAAADSNPEAGKGKKSETPEPIVIDRYHFKQDVRGFLDSRYRRLYVFDVDKREATLLTAGAYDSTQPSWSPDSRLIAFTSRRGDDPDRHVNDDIYVIEASATASTTPRRLTDWDGPDTDPVFSPDGRSVAFLRGGPPKYVDYDPAVLAVVPVAGGDAKPLTAGLDRSVSSPRWSLDGKSVYFLFVNDRVASIGRVQAKGGDVQTIYPQRQNPAVVREFVIGRNGLAATTAFATQPAELYRVRDGRALSAHNAELVAEIDWASVEGYDGTSADGTRIGAMLLKSPGFRPGVDMP
ncbi:MAG: PD40 domain-containing protein, partial [Halioglobus sp.]|nr:PD40 domain-containing protein [Halioglobus sp.]